MLVMNFSRSVAASTLAPILSTSLWRGVMLVVVDVVVLMVVHVLLLVALASWGPGR